MKDIAKIMISDAELHQAFKREFPKDLDHVTSAKEILPYDFDSLKWLTNR
jgi:hypothetical protein